MLHRADRMPLRSLVGLAAALALAAPAARAQQPATRPDSARPADAPAERVRKDAASAPAAQPAPRPGAMQHGQHGTQGAGGHGGMQHGAGHGAAHGGMQGHATSGWKEMDAFHAHMMQAWHPVRQRDDVAPARAHAAPMADAAEAWARAAVPRACDTPATRDAVAAIARDARAFATLAARADAPDAEVRQALAALHERFEPVEHGCGAGGPGTR